MNLKIFKGTFSYLSGVMGKLAPDSVKIETPVGMVAVRGTHFLVKVDKCFGGRYMPRFILLLLSLA